MKKNFSHHTAWGSWAKRLNPGKMRYKTVLENIPRIVINGIDEEFEERLANYLSVPELVKCSGLSPYRYLEVYAKIKALSFGRAGCLLDALDEAARLSLGNLKGFDPSLRVLIANNFSESMLAPVTPGSPVRRIEIGVYLAYLLNAAHNPLVTGVFGSTWETVQIIGAVMSNTMNAFHFARFFRMVAGEGTNGASAIDYLIKENRPMDRVMLFAACKMWDGAVRSDRAEDSLSQSWVSYKKSFPKAELYVVDLSGDGLGKIERQKDDVFLISGWNENVLMGNK